MKKMRTKSSEPEIRLKVQEVEGNKSYQELCYEQSGGINKKRVLVCDEMYR